MASFFAKLNLDGSDFDILSCDYSLSQPVNAKGRPLTSVSSGLIRIALIGKNHDLLTNWALDSKKKYNGVIVFQEINGFGKFKEVSFEEGYCVSYKEVFTPNYSTETTFTFHIGISASKIQIDQVVHDNLWRENA